MGRRNALFGAIVATAVTVARSAPQKNAPAIFPIRNDTSVPEPTNPTCIADCRVRYPELQAISWVPEVQIVFTTEIIVGTATVYSTILENSTSPPRTHTVFNVDVPTEYSLWMIRSNGDGTAFVEVPLTISGSYTLKTLVYPTPWLDYPSEYHWEGILPTTGKRAEPFCATATELDIGVLDPHPTYPQPKPSLDAADPVGASHKPLWIPIQDTPDKKWFDATFPSVSAFASCESVPGKPAPTEYSAPKFVFETTTSIISRTTSGFIPIIQSSETGFEDTRTIESTKRPTLPTRTQAPTHSVIEPTTSQGPDKTDQTGPHFMSTETGFEIPGAHQTVPPPEVTGSPETRLPGAIPSVGNDNIRPPVTPMPALANPTPVFTLVPTVVNGKPYASPAFVLPDSSSLASIGERVTINGEPTVLTAPEAVYTMVPTIVNGVSTSVPVYIIRGSVTALPGETVVINGQQTALSDPHARYTSITTMFNGKETVIPVYIIDGSVTATLGQTVTIDGTTTVLSTPTATDSIDTQFGGPAVSTMGGQPRQTGTSEGARVRSVAYAWWVALLLGMGALSVMIL